MKPIPGPLNSSFARTFGLAVFFALTAAANAQTYTLLHSFASFTASTQVQGANPAASVILSNNILYGTTQNGGNSSNGTVFAVNTDGSGLTNLHNFTVMSAPWTSSTNGGANPSASLILSDGFLYGTTQSGGTKGFGTVFAASTNGAGITTLYSFTNGVDGSTPLCSLILSGNTLYGTTEFGGKSFTGTVFAINTDGTGFTNLYSFTNGVDGASPFAGLALSGNTLYGTTEYGGKNLNGTVFAINTDGTGFTILHTFTFFDGSFPMAGLVLSGGVLFGTTWNGGTSFDGTIFSINTDGSGFTNFYNFTGGDDGSAPKAALTLSGEVLYGTASAGGSNGFGTVFSIQTGGTGFTNLYNFTGGAGGLNPQTTLYLTNNILYGTTEYGGASGNGIMFALNADGPGFTNLYSFTGSDDGGNPAGGLVGDTLYGTTVNGGTDGYGVLFAINPNGTGLTNLYSFTPPNNKPSEANPDGANPMANLILSSNVLYGTTENGGSAGNGTVFAVNTDGTGFTNLYSFTVRSDGAEPVGNVILSGGTLYGTTQYGGESDRGTVFSINIDGSDFTILYRFTNQPDGANPVTGLTLSGNTLYGTTEHGGNYDDGTLFAINTDGSGYTNFYSFTGEADGGNPVSGLVLSGNSLYGTTEFGTRSGYGTLYSIQIDGTNVMPLHEFTGSPDGGNPYGTLLLAGNTLYGTTGGGGTSGNGAIFAINTSGTGYTNIYSFPGGNGGASYPVAGLILSGSTLYGTTEDGGAEYSGVVFSISTNGMNYANVVSFEPNPGLGPKINSEGANPQGGLILSGTTLYGTAGNGGSASYGTVFSLQTDGSNFANLHSFTNGNDGANPMAGLLQLGNVLYGTAAYGGKSGGGTVFGLNADGSGFTTLHSFTGGSDGANPAASLIFWSNALYGTAQNGGSLNAGTVFSLQTNGSNFLTVYTFAGGADGGNPAAALLVWSNSWLLGEAEFGGTYGFGTLFAIDLFASGQMVKLGGSTFYAQSFTGGGGGSYGWSGLTQDGGSLIDGTSGNGSTGNFGSAGTVPFAPTSGFGKSTQVSLDGTDGAGLEGAFLYYNNLYWATATSGGASGGGCLITYNPATSTIVDVYDFLHPQDGTTPVGPLVPQGPSMYGVVEGGGADDEGGVFEFTPASSEPCSNMVVELTGTAGNYVSHPFPFTDNNYIYVPIPLGSSVNLTVLLVSSGSSGGAGGSTPSSVEISQGSLPANLSLAGNQITGTASVDTDVGVILTVTVDD
jgi:uncharacterized repeat protein (TIGR03803 family)